MKKDLDLAIKELRGLPNKRECLNRVYQILTKKYYGDKAKTCLLIPKILSRNVGKLWLRNGFMHCTSLNCLAKAMLVGSGHFKEEDIKLKWTLIYWISPHQYMKIKISDDEELNVDIWAHKYGIKPGEYAHGFNI